MSLYHTYLTRENEAGEENEILVEVAYDYIPGYKGCRTLRNGDPGYPPEPATVDLYDVREENTGSKFYLTLGEQDRIEEAILMLEEDKALWRDE